MIPQCLSLFFFSFPWLINLSLHIILLKPWNVGFLPASTNHHLMQLSTQFYQCLCRSLLGALLFPPPQSTTISPKTSSMFRLGGLHHRIRHSHWPALDIIHPTEGLVISRPVPLRLYSRTDISLTGFSHQIPPRLFSCPQFIVLRYLISFSMLFTQVNCSENVLWQQFCNSSNLR